MEIETPIPGVSRPFPKGTNSKYFQFCDPYRLCQYITLPKVEAAVDNMEKYGYGGITK